MCRSGEGVNLSASYSTAIMTLGWLLLGMQWIKASHGEQKEANPLAELLFVMSMTVQVSLYDVKWGVYGLSMRKPETLRAIADPIERAQSATAAVAEAQRLATEYSQITHEAVREMRQTMSYGAVAKALGVSRTRVQQLER